MRLSNADGSNGTLVNNVSLPDDTDDDTNPRIVQLTDGRLLIAWSESGDIRGRIYNEDGSNPGSEFNITNNSTLNFADLELVALEDGGYYTVFRDDTEGRLLGVRGLNGTQQGITIIISDDADGVGGNIGDFSASLTTDGRILVSWENGEIYTKILDPRLFDTPIIAEAGDGQTTDRQLTNNTLVGSAAADVIYGLDGDDIIEGRAGADTLDGGDNGAGGDTISYANSGAGVAVNLRQQIAGSFANSVSDAQGDVISGFENVIGSNFADQLIASGNGGTMDGRDGDDVFILGGILVGLAEPTLIHGGGGADTLQFGGGSVGSNSFDLAASTISSIERLVFSDPGMDRTQDVFFRAAQFGEGLLSNELFVTFDAFADTRETIHVALDTISNSLDLTGLTFGGFVGANSGFAITGSSVADTIIGSSVRNLMRGEGGDDRLEGGAANDTLNGGTGNDTLLGGAGNDTYVVDSAGDQVFETTATSSGIDAGGIDRVRSSVTFSLDATAGVRFVEHLVLIGSGNINGTGNALANRLIGNTGNNVLNGGQGNDTLVGGAGNDTMLGGAGNDVYVVDSINDRVFETTTTTSGIDAGGIDTVRSSVTYSLDTVAGVRFVENLVLTGLGFINGTGNALANRLTGNDANNMLSGGLGDDTLFGGAGNDTLLGGAGNDTYIVTSAVAQVFETTTTASGIDAGGIDKVRSSVSFDLDATAGVRFVENLILTGTGNINGTGNALANRIIGNAGNNVLNGGLGNDLLTGGAGNDSFVFSTTLGLGNVDRITDFSVVEDIILLDDAVFVGLATGGLAVPAFTANLSGQPTDIFHRIIYQTDTGRLFFDADGTGPGAPIHFATLSPDLALTAADFAVI